MQIQDAGLLQTRNIGYSTVTNNNAMLANSVLMSNEPGNLSDALSRSKLQATLTQDLINKYMPFTFYLDAVQELKILGKNKNHCTRCQICLIEFESTSMVRITICQHIFHKACLEMSLRQKELCPLCRCQLNKRYLEIYHQHSQLKEQMLATSNLMTASQNLTQQRFLGPDEEQDTGQAEKQKSQALNLEDAEQQLNSASFYKTAGQREGVIVQDLDPQNSNENASQVEDGAPVK